MLLNDIVRDDELEISIFGRGFGEAVVVHLPGGAWLIVDSFLVPEIPDPVPLKYLRSIGVDTANDVKCIVASHWHLDHIDGLASIVSECKTAEFWCSAALEQPDLRDLVYAYGRANRNLGRQCGTEFIDITKILKSRPKPSRASINPINMARADTRIYQASFQFDDQEIPVEIWALSPSSAALVKATAQLPMLWERYKRRLECDYRPTNDICVVLLVQVGPISVLLGSDLQEVADPQDGWAAIVNSTRRPQLKSLSFKVPHHGSANGYYAQVWKDMLLESPIAALTPFQHGNINLPKKEEIEIICGHTQLAYIAGRMRRQKIRKADSMVQKRQTMRTEKFRWLKPSLGHIRIRASIFNLEDHQVELGGEAILLSEWQT